jgi:hypothetical protein
MALNEDQNRIHTLALLEFMAVNRLVRDEAWP